MTRQTSLTHANYCFKNDIVHSVYTLCWHLIACENQAVLQHRKLVLLLDYDGTLTPIVNDPSKALLSDRVSESPTRPLTVKVTYGSANSSIHAHLYKGQWCQERVSKC